ncbi:response regulator [Aeromonas hydrophila]|uniref:response regulator n=1 Tax=Aeromonas hydrophila TaxID=644 RepID=UPI00130389E3|nr:transporter substrate-binding domain-containing protein [Aeromonas hydrophila]QGZ71104.1 transporter substrate-binding domain-containing protein [Aeromonas hydrophila]
MPIIVFLLFFVGVASATEAQGDAQKILNVYSREVSPDYKKMMLSLSEKERLWLKEKKQLILAVPTPDNPPMDITLRGGEYEGVTADILGVIENIIGIKVFAKPFSSRAAAINAVRNGEVDMIGSSNSYEVGEGLALSIPYVPDEPAVYKRFGVTRDQIKTLAIAESYLPFSEVIRYVPGVKVNVFPTRYAAVAAVAYGKADAVLIDMISGNFLINKLYQDELQLDRPIYASTAGFSFGVSENNEVLQGILNNVLIGIAEFNVKSVIKRWSGGGMSIQSKQVELTDSEWQWLHDKGKLRVAVGTVLPPLSFIDEQGNFHGVVSDLFQILSTKLGVEIEPIMLSYANDEQLSALEGGYVDAAMMTATATRRKKFSFTKSFYIEPLVYIVNKDNSEIEPNTLAKVGRVAVLRGLISNFDNHSFFGDISHPEYFDRIESALSCVAQDNCDMTIIPLRTAKFYLNSKSEMRSKLIISGELFGSVPVTANFAVLPKKNMLLSILDKVISSIPPDELDSLATRARVSERSYVFTWKDLFRTFGTEILVVVFILIGCAVWLFFLRRQIHQRKKAEKALSSQLYFIEELVDSMPHPIYAFDLSRKLILCNKSYSSLFGLSRNDLLGKSFPQLQAEHSFIKPLSYALEETFCQGHACEGDYQLHLNSRVMEIFHWLQVYRDLGGGIQGVVGGWIDVSDRVALVRELADASRSAEEASRAKSTFLATMSHEIRTPMNAIIGLLELTLRKDGLNTEDRDAVRVAYQASHDLLGLIGDILDLSKIESGKLELLPSLQNINDLNRSVINVFSVVARQKGLALTLHNKSDVVVMVDPIRYKQVLSNLVNNAIKFTRKGGVDLVVDLRPDGEWCGIVVSVIDTGIGISDEDLEYLFLPFSQATQPADIQKSGTGLGLMISRTLCQMMGGDLKISSELGQGTKVVVSLRLPLAETLVVCESHSEKMVSPSYDDMGYRILVIDDHPTNLLLISQQLAFLGHQVLTAGSGKAALQLLSKEHVDIIITDFNMPDIDGFEFTASLRQQERDDEALRTVVIGLTADARQDQVQRAMEAGMDDCLFKPVSLDELEVCLATHHPGKMLLTPEDMAARFMHKLSNLTVGSSELMSALLNEFVNASEQDMLHLAEACMQGNSQKFLAQLHRLKGGARILGADELVACCTEWEQSPRLSVCMPAALRQVRNMYQQVKAGVDYWNKEHKTRGE